MSKRTGKKKTGQRKSRERRNGNKNYGNKSGRGVIVGIAAAVILTGIGAVAYFLQNKSVPEDTLLAYSKLVNQRDYDGMYELLSEEAQKDISKEAFTERNQKIYEGIEAKNLVVQCEEESESKTGKKEAELSYTCEMESMAGKISFVNKIRLVKESGDWKLDWDSTFIFPILKDDYRVQINTRPAVRGNIYDRNGILLAGQGAATEVGVDSGKIDPNANFGDVGLSWQKDAGWGDYYVTTLTPYGPDVNLNNAMTYSDNIYFARASLEIGAKIQTEGFRKMGFKEEMDFPLYLAPSTYDSDDSDGEIASEIQLADTGYGQGELLVNPVHLLSMYSMFANGGNMIAPVLIQEEGQKPQYWKEQVISEQTAEIVKQSLIQVIENPAGTGASAKIEGVSMLGKTGTAEIKETQDSTEGVERGWFICETLEGVERPIAVVGMVEDVKLHGGSGYVTGKVRAIVAQYYGK